MWEGVGTLGNGKWETQVKLVVVCTRYMLISRMLDGVMRASSRLKNQRTKHASGTRSATVPRTHAH